MVWELLGKYYRVEMGDKIMWLWDWGEMGGNII